MPFIQLQKGSKQKPCRFKIHLHLYSFINIKLSSHGSTTKSQVFFMMDTLKQFLDLPISQLFDSQYYNAQWVSLEYNEPL